MAAVALAASFAPSLMARRRREQLAVSAGSAILGAAAGWGAETLVAQVARRLGDDARLLGRLPGPNGDAGAISAEAEARLLIAGAGAAAALLRLDSRRPAVALAGTALRVAGIAALVGWTAPAKRRTTRFDPVPLLGAGALALGVQAVRADRRRRARPHVPYPVDAPLPTVSFGPDSLVAGLDAEGRRFVAGATPGLAMDPIRVFVGLRSAADVGARCDLAMAELQRLGAFERSRVVICSATLRGYVNPIPVAAEERFCDGDVAHVVVQYFDKRTPWLWRKVPIAAQTHRELLARIGRHVGDAELCVSGESLGAWASQQVFRADGLDGLDRAGVARALWVGTPGLSRAGRGLKRSPGVRVLRARDVLEADPPDAAGWRVVLLERLTDPVVLFPGLELLWRRRGAGWKPGVSFVQSVLDLVKATRWTAEQPSTAGHDYRIELPLVVNLAFGHRRPRPEAERIATAVLEAEAARVAAVRAQRQAALSASARTRPAAAGTAAAASRPSGT